MNKNDFKIIKLLLNEYASILISKLCDLSMAMSDTTNIETQKRFEQEFQKQEEKYLKIVNIAKKLY